MCRITWFLYKNMYNIHGNILISISSRNFIQVRDAFKRKPFRKINVPDNGAFVNAYVWRMDSNGVAIRIMWAGKEHYDNNTVSFYNIIEYYYYYCWCCCNTRHGIYHDGGYKSTNAVCIHLSCAHWAKLE